MYETRHSKSSKIFKESQPGLVKDQNNKTNRKERQHSFNKKIKTEDGQLTIMSLFDK